MRVLQTPSKRESGFTLLEVLIAIVILSVGLLGMAALTVGIINGNRFSNEVSKATTLAQDKMEDIRRLGYSGMPATDTTDTEAYGTITDFPEYRRDTVTDVFTAGVAWPPEGMKTITVTVFWQGTVKIHSVELKTILAQ